MENEQILKLISKAYEFSYPLVIMDLTRRQGTNTNKVDQVKLKAPHNQFIHFRSLPRGNDKSVVRFNFDTLYSQAWLDLTEEPIVLTVPHLPDRYHLTPIYDMWSDILAVPGTRTTDGIGQKFVISYGDYKGVLPENTKLIKSTTPYMWIIGRIQVNGESDYDFVHSKQDQYSIVPLSEFGNKNYIPKKDNEFKAIADGDPQALSLEMNGFEYFNYFCEVLKINPPHVQDNPILFQLEKIGIVPGKSFSPNEVVNSLLDEGIKLGKQNILKSFGDPSFAMYNGPWNWVQNGIGVYGTNYKIRTLIAYAGLGANLAEDAIYPNIQYDNKEKRLHGKNNYILHFEKENIPPANAFWSITLYDKQGFQVDNSINRYSLGDRDTLSVNDDGSIDVYIQKEKPSDDKVTNWLPSLNDEFDLTLRLYSPSDKALANDWRIPIPTIN